MQSGYEFKHHKFQLLILYVPYDNFLIFHVSFCLTSYRLANKDKFNV